MRSALHIRMADDDSMRTSPRSDPNRCRRSFCICPTSLERPPTKIMWSRRSKSAPRKRLEKKPPKYTLYVDNLYPWTAYKAMAYDLDDMQAICVCVYIYSIHVMSYIPREFTLLLSISSSLVPLFCGSNIEIVRHLCYRMAWGKHQECIQISGHVIFHVSSYSLRACGCS